MNEKRHNDNGLPDREALRDIIRWDIDNWSRALPFWEKNAELRPGMKALGVGEREGGLSLWLALKGLDVICTEYTEFPEATALLHKKYNIAHRVTYQREDVCHLSFGDARFDVVILKSMLGALQTKERQRKAVAEIYRVLKPGGVLLLAENTEATLFHRVIRKKFAKWASRWRYLSLKKGDLDLFDAFSEKKTATAGFWGFMAKGPLIPVIRIAERISAPFVPKAWNYILFAVFKKPTHTFHYK